MNPGLSTSAIQSKLNGANLMTKLQVYASQGIQKVRARLQRATEAFHDTLEAEQRLATLAVERTATVPGVITRLHLGGFLVSLASDRVFPVYEGANFFCVTKDGTLSSVQTPGKSGSDYTLRIQENEGVLEAPGDLVKPESFTSNDTLTLGCEPFSLKLLPREYRVVHEITRKAEEQK